MPSSTSSRMPSRRELSRPPDKGDHEDDNSPRVSNSAEEETLQANQMFPDRGHQGSGPGGPSGSSMPVSESLENIYSPWSQVGLVHQPFSAVEKQSTTAVQITTLRKGKWSEEEELFTKKLIAAFHDGHLLIPIGTTLRTFLSEKLFW